jgi:hypothetical protein
VLSIGGVHTLVNVTIVDPTPVDFVSKAAFSWGLALTIVI